MSEVTGLLRHLRKSPSVVCDVIRQFVSVVWLTGKMLGQQGAGFFDAVNNSVRELSFAEMDRHGISNFRPKVIAALCMNSFVADDCKLVHARSDKDEHTIASTGFFHAEAHKGRLGCGNGVIDGFAADENADFAGGLAFGFTNSRDNLFVAKLIQEFFRAHITSFLRLLRLRSFPRLRRTRPHLLQKNLRHRHPSLRPNRHHTSLRWNKTIPYGGAEP